MTTASGGISASSATILAASISAGVLLAVFGLTELVKSIRNRSGRQYKEQRTSLTDLENAAADYRSAVQAYGAAARRSAAGSDEVADAQVVMVDAGTRLDVARSRVHEEPVLTALDSWRGKADISFISTLDVPASEEEVAWQIFIATVGERLNTT